MSQWRYKTVALHNGEWFDIDEDFGPPVTFNELGKQGWELVGMHPMDLPNLQWLAPDALVAVFKRSVPSQTAFAAYTYRNKEHDLSLNEEL